ncbi:beta-1,6-N-acetylglucosaminyltransferase [Lactococcus chungangensis]|uniref:beta-1,6-N-acetylglucosaminyltransferase n=1 Tax=Pseudolactococcus chungangensis TaxID=451457 RepID=UPI0037362DC6
MADSNFSQLKSLIGILDDKRNDIFIHIDKKVTFDTGTLMHFCRKSNLYIIPRIKVYWGGSSLMYCELNLFKYAHDLGKYDYYHLLSGKDFPLQSQDYIHNFFKQNEGVEFVHIANKNSMRINKVNERVNFFYFFTNWSYKRINNKCFSFLFKIIRYIQKSIYKLLRFNIYKKYNLHLGYGSQWVSIDNDLVEEILKKQNLIKKIYKHSLIPDELFIQTIILNNLNFKKRVYIDRLSHKPSNLRYLKFLPGNGSPVTWTYKDFDELKKAKNDGYLFVRKLDCKVDNVIIKEILKKL